MSDVFDLNHQWNLHAIRGSSSPSDPTDSSNWLPGNQTEAGLSAMVGTTVWSQVGEAYKFVADLDDPDKNKSLLAPGVSEDPNETGPNGLSDVNQAAWVSGTMYAAPMTWGTFTEHPFAILSYP